jgi:hypothetical protein
MRPHSSSRDWQDATLERGHATLPDLQMFPIDLSFPQPAIQSTLGFL